MKIALLVSGQVRTYDNIKEFGPTYIKSEFEKRGHTVDIVGVKWDTCELNSNVDEFSDILTVSNSDFENWILADTRRRFIVNGCYANRNKNAIKDSTWLLESTKHACAQHYLFGKGLRYVIDSGKEYDLLIRWRWDVQIGVHTCIDRQTSVNYFIYLAEHLAVEKTRHGTNVLAPEVKIEEGSYFPGDTTFIFEYDIVRKMFNEFDNIEDVIDKMNATNSSLDRYSDHALWRELLLYIDARVLCNIPEFVIGLDKNRK